MKKFNIRHLGKFDDTSISVIEKMEYQETLPKNYKWISAGLTCHAIILERNQKRQILNTLGEEISINDLDVSENWQP